MKVKVNSSHQPTNTRSQKNSTTNRWPLDLSFGTRSAAPERTKARQAAGPGKGDNNLFNHFPHYSLRAGKTSKYGSLQQPRTSPRTAPTRRSLLADDGTKRRQHTLRAVRLFDNPANSRHIPSTNDETHIHTPVLAANGDLHSLLFHNTAPVRYSDRHLLPVDLSTPPL